MVYLHNDYSYHNLTIILYNMSILMIKNCIRILKWHKDKFIFYNFSS